MNTADSKQIDPITHAFDVTRRRLHRQAVQRLVLYAWFALMSAAAIVLLVRVWSHHGVASLGNAWPALVLQIIAAVTLVWLLRHQFVHVAELRARSRTLRAATEAQLRGLQRHRRQSIVLIGIAALAVPTLLFAVSRLSASGAVSGHQSIWLALLCLLPTMVICGVHVPRLSRLKRTRGRLEDTLQQLDETP
ncbi:MAG: hypothetical protein WCD66_05580 [Rhodanobacteraceae bacterium]